MLLRDLSKIVRGGQIFLTRSLAEFDLNSAEEIVLMYIFGNPETNQDAIASFFMLDKGTVARTLARLEEKGFIKRRVNYENQREKIITPTEKANSVKDVCMGLLNAWNDILYTGISKEDAEIFERMACCMAENITKKLKQEIVYGK